MKRIGLKMNGKEMRMTIGVKAIRPMKMRQHGKPKAGMNLQSPALTTSSAGNSQRPMQCIPCGQLRYICTIIDLLPHMDTSC